MCIQAGYDGAEGLRIAPLGGDSAQFQQRCRIVGLRGKNLLQQLLEFSFSIGIALTLHFLCQQVHGAQVARVYLGSLAQRGNGLGGVAAFALEDT